MALVLLVLATEVVFGEMAIAYPLVVDRVRRRRPGLLDGLGGQLEQDLCRKGVVGRLQGGQLLHDEVHVCVLSCGQTEEAEAGGSCRSPRRWGQNSGPCPNARSMRRRPA